MHRFQEYKTEVSILEGRAKNLVFSQDTSENRVYFLNVEDSVLFLLLL